MITLTIIITLGIALIVMILKSKSRAKDASLKGLNVGSNGFKTDVIKVGNYYVSVQSGRKKCKNIFQSRG